MFAAERISYDQTNSFPEIVLDYLNEAEDLKPFYSLPPTLEGLQQAIENRKKYKTDREALVEVLKDQYQSMVINEAVQHNIEFLLSENTFTVTTAHQPNLFTGPLYFIYKILHAINLAESLRINFPQYNFVPVFYMGSEDADLDELNHFTVNGKKYTWKTHQKGAVGRMAIDKSLVALIDELHQQTGVQPFGKEITEHLKKFYTEGRNIQEATLQFVHLLFGKFGLVILIADDKRLKKQMIPVFEEDIFEQKPSEIVASTSEKLEKIYKVQAHSREINLFYLREDIRERIEKENDQFSILNTEYLFSEEELKKELQEYPERFSPNVILRGMYQEKILPNIAFIGGGGELAYWLQLKDLFENYSVPFPVLLLRNSFLIVEKEEALLLDKIELPVNDLFETELNILNKLIQQKGKRPQLNGELQHVQEVYEELKTAAISVDPSLQQHVEALKTKTVNAITELEKNVPCGKEET